MGMVFRAFADMFAVEPPLPGSSLEPSKGASQCSYELLRAFSKYTRSRQLRFTLAAGTLLGAMRNSPPGLLQWEHDVDVYMLASEAAQLIHRLREDCPSTRWRWRSRWCATLQLRGLVDRAGQPCCGFGYKLFHRRSDACELDVLVLAAAEAPFMHGETILWPPWGIFLARAYNKLMAVSLSMADALLTRDGGTLQGGAAGASGRFYVIPEDVYRKSLMADETRWCDEKEADNDDRNGGESSSRRVWCGGPPLSFFHAEYFAPGDLFPLHMAPFYDLQLPVPHRPWALLNRTYGHECAYIARINEHSDAVADLRRPQHSHLLKPAPVKHLPWWRA
jgi:hypothetical protein